MASSNDNKNEWMGIPARTLDMDMREEKEEEMPPPPDTDGRIATLNQMGYMSPDLLELTNVFVRFAAATCASRGLPVLDGGVAYGVSTVAALQAGATVIANDIDEKHLRVLARSSALTPEQRGRLFLKAGALPNGMVGDDIPRHSLGAIHLARMMHFLRPAEVEAMFQRAAEWLAPGGRLYIITASMFHHSASGFDRVYEARRKEGQEWPGIIENFTKEYGREHAGKAQEFLHLMDPRVLMRVATKHGFFVRKLEIVGYHEHDSEYVAGVFVPLSESDRD